MICSSKYGMIAIGKQLHVGMVHTIAQLALLFKTLFGSIVAVFAVFGVYCFDDVMLVHKYHILPCNKTEHERPGAKNMISAFLQNKLCFLQYCCKSN